MIKRYKTFCFFFHFWVISHLSNSLRVDAAGSKEERHFYFIFIAVKTYALEAVKR